MPKLSLVKENSDRASDLLEEIKTETDPAVRLNLYEQFRRCLLILMNISIDPASQLRLRSAYSQPNLSEVITSPIVVS